MSNENLQQIRHHCNFQRNQNEKKKENKTPFLKRYDLLEYVIMFFDLCNVSKTFQIFINDTLRKFLNDFCTSYLNDILIYNDNNKKHVAHVSKILE